MIETKSFLLKCTFTEPVLGSQPTIDVASEFLIKRAGLDELPPDEMETLPEVLERGTTVFHKRNGKYLLMDYQFKGFLKEAGRTFNGLNGVKALRSKIDMYVFIEPREIKLHIPEGIEVAYLERPLRAETAQGPRVTLARSEMLAEGTWFEVYMDLFPCAITEEMLRDLLDYGSRKGLGQWRNGGYGRFVYKMEKVDGGVG